MGLLDEAIKQHLDLKRRRGADPGEVDRLEQEALGPVRRAQHEDSIEDAAPAHETAVSYDELEYGDEAYEGDELGSEGGYEPVDEEFDAPSRRAAAMPHAPLSTEPEFESDPLGAHGVAPPQGDELLEDMTEPEEAHPETVQPPIPEDDLGAATVEYDVEAEHAREQRQPAGGESQPEGKDADMLEETPEFFQDAPDHDRLWFEQRPPKDFDFDG